MGETSVYYVPENQDAWAGRAEELAEKMWNLGVFLQTPGIMQRLCAARDSGQLLPNCALDINQKFGYMGVSDEIDEHLVPNYIYDITCPSCAADMMHTFYDASDTDLEIPAKERPVTCLTCGSTFRAKDLRFGQPLSFARFYVFVSDCEQEEWEPRFRKALEEIVGPCREYWEWST